MTPSPLFLDLHTIPAHPDTLKLLATLLVGDSSNFTSDALLMPEASQIGILCYACEDIRGGQPIVAIGIGIGEHEKYRSQVEIVQTAARLIGAYIPIVIWNEWPLHYLLGKATILGEKMPRLVDAKPWKGEVFALQNILASWRGKLGYSYLNFEFLSAAYGMWQPWSMFTDEIFTSADIPTLMGAFSDKAIAYSLWRVAVMRALWDSMSGVLVPDYGVQSEHHFANDIELAQEYFIK